MERGQITIPYKIRDMFNIQKGTRLSFKVTTNKQMIIEPIENTNISQLNSFIEQTVQNKKVYWSDTDTKMLRLVKQKTIQKTQNTHGKNIS